MDPYSLVIIVFALGALWLMTRKGRSRQNAALQFRANLAPGQDVMTASGLLATIVAVDGDVVTLETSPGITSRWVRRAILEPFVPSAVDADDDEVDEDLGTGSTAGPSLVKRDPDDLRVPDDLSSLTTDPDEGDTKR